MTTDTDAAAPVAVKPAPVIKHLRDRSGVFALDYPIEVDGKVMDKIAIRRMTVGEVAAFVQETAGDDNISYLRFPIFYAENGDRLSKVLIDALDDDDAARLVQEALSFLPRRYQVDTDSDTAPSTGEPTEQPSSE